MTATCLCKSKSNSGSSWMASLMIALTVSAPMPLFFAISSLEST
jgi:hypothetical protein